MSTPHLRVSGVPGGIHPAVASRRVRTLVQPAVAGALALGCALAVTVALPHGSPVSVVALTVGLLGIAALIATPRLDIAVAAAVVFLGCLDGPIKLIGTGGVVGAALQDVVVLAVCLGVLGRLLMRRESVHLPPLGGWVIAFTLVVMVEAFNPNTHGILKVIAGFRQQLQWVPFFFFGYMLIRSKASLEKMFLLLGVIALLNGVAATGQTQVSPNQLASVGPGYNQKINGAHPRKYVSEGQARVRPLGLGGDSGFGAGVGLIALAGTLALIANMPRDKRWLALLLCFGAIAAIATGLGRLQVGGAVITVLAFAGLTTLAGGRIAKPVAALLLTVAIMLPLSLVFISAVGPGVFSRYASIAPESAVSKGTSYKEGSLLQIPNDISHAPFGFGLATAGSVSGFGGKTTELLEGHNLSAETQFNFLVKELGLPGLIVWTAFMVRLIMLASVRLRRVRDDELQTYLAAVFAPMVAFFFMSFDGPVMASAAAGPYFWFAGGIAAYWFLGPGSRDAREARSRAPHAPARLNLSGAT